MFRCSAPEQLHVNIHWSSELSLGHGQHLRVPHRPKPPGRLPSGESSGEMLPVESASGAVFHVAHHQAEGGRLIPSS